MRTDVRPSFPEHTQLRARLDALRLKLHLGGMETKEKFDELYHEVTALRASAVASW